MRDEHDESITVYKCELCDYASNYKQKWEAHYQRHFTSPAPLSLSPDSLGTSGELARNSTPTSHSDNPAGVSSRFGQDAMMIDFTNLGQRTPRSGTPNSIGSAISPESGIKSAESTPTFVYNRRPSSEDSDRNDNDRMPDDKRLFQQLAGSVLPRVDGASDLRRLEEMTHQHDLSFGRPSSHLLGLHNDKYNQEASLRNLCGQYTKMPSLLDSNSLQANVAASWPMSAMNTSDEKRSTFSEQKMGISHIKPDMRQMTDIQTKKADVSNPISKPKLYAPFREAVDPAKYITIQEADGVKYACSKCGNVYKWRKSLNKHWKEKHDGEIPDPRNSYTPLAIPRVQPGTNKKDNNPLMAAALKHSTMHPSLNPQKMPFHDYSIAMTERQQFTTPNSLTSAGKENHPKIMEREQMDFAASLPNPLEGLVINKQLTSPAYGRPTPPQLPSPVNLGGRPYSKRTSPPLPSPVSLTNKTSPTQNAPPAAHSNGPRFHIPLHEDIIDLSSVVTPGFPAENSAVDTGILDLSVKGKPSVTPEPRAETKPPQPPQDQPLDFSKKPPAAHLVEHNSRKPEYTTPNCAKSPNEQSNTSLSLRCPSCSYIANTMKDYNHHMEVHLRKDVYRCASCQECFPSVDGLNLHFQAEHFDILRSDSFSSDGRLGTSQTTTGSGSHQLFKYLTMDAGRHPLNCLVCGAVFQWQWTLAKHFATEHAGLPNPYRKTGATNEFHEDDNVATKKLRQMSAPLHDKGLLQSVKPNQPGMSSPLKCSQCDYMTVSYAELSRHQLKHSISTNFTCKVCTFTTRWREDMLSHCKRYHPGMDLDIIWQESSGGKPTDGTPEHGPVTPIIIAPDGNSGMMDLSVDGTAVVIPRAPEDTMTEFHSQAITNRKQLQSKSKMTGPTNSAEMLLPYKCSVCEYRARWPSEISQHMKNHSDEKPFHCPRCSYRSKWKWDVVKHLKRCGGGTVKDVIDTSKTRNSEETPILMMKATTSTMPDATSASGKMSGNAGRREALSNGPPNVTVSTPVKEADIMPHLSMSVKNDLEVQDFSIKSESVHITEGVIFQNNCNHCPFVANSPAELRRHTRVHSDEKPFVCRTCGYCSKWKCDLKKHLRTYNHESAVPLTYGGHGRKPAEWYAQQDGEKNKEKDGSVKISCPRCPFTSSSPEEMESHKNIHQLAGTSFGKVLHCRQCDFECDDFGIFLQHKLKHNEEKYKTDDATESGSPVKHRRKPLKQFVMRNMDRSLDESGLMMDDRIRQSRSVSSLDDSNIEPEKSALLAALGLEVTSKLQMMPRKRPSPPVGTVMPIMQDTNWLRMSHMASSGMSSKAANYRCAHCPYSTENRTTFEKHMRMHNTPNRYMCEWCNWSTDRLNLLYRHAQSVHPDELAKEEKESFYDKVRERSYSEGSREGTPLRTYSPVKALSPLAKIQSTEKLNSLKNELLSVTKKLAKKTFKPNSGTREEVTKTKRKIKRCKKCAYITDNVTTLQRHIAKHGFPGKFTCDYCDYSVNKKHIRDYHMRIVHNNVQVDDKTNEKDEIFEETADYGYEEGVDTAEEEEVIESKTNGEIPETDVFNPDIMKKEGVITQVTRIRGQNMRLIRDQNKTLYGCLKCTFVTANVTNSINHGKQHGTKKKYRCEICDYSLDQMRHIIHHMRNFHSTNSRDNSSDGSGNEWSNTAGSADDSQITPEKEIEEPQLKPRALVFPSRSKPSTAPGFQCRKCSFKTTNLVLFVKHKRFHNQQGSRLTCGECGHRASTTRLLRRHEKIHKTQASNGKDINASTLSCHECLFVAKSADGLKNHRRLHETRGQYNCDQCSYSADDKQLMYKHARFHGINGGSPVKKLLRCHICPYSTRVQSLMTTHVQSHTTSKTISCQFCPLTISQSNAVKHMTGHLKTSGESTELCCAYCPFTSSFKHSVGEHIKKHDTLSSIKCHFCSYSADDESDIKYHLNLHFPSPLSNNTMDAMILKYVSPGDNTSNNHMSINGHSKANTHGSGDIMCRYCDKLFTDHKQRELHEERHQVNTQ